ncbi:MAG: hypothetical protein JXQ75_12555, partial [Phycisphaerae bacterium]|nr:hypothetical protein [Phycisphaerae bacterium]
CANNPINFVDPLGLGTFDMGVSWSFAFVYGAKVGIKTSETGIHFYFGHGLMTPGLGGWVTVGPGYPTRGKRMKLAAQFGFAVDKEWYRRWYDEDCRDKAKATGWSVGLGWKPGIMWSRDYISRAFLPANLDPAGTLTPAERHEHYPDLFPPGPNIPVRELTPEQRRQYYPDLFPQEATSQ